MSNLEELDLQQVDSTLERWRLASLPDRPRKGWIRTVRAALCMSARALGERIGVSEAAVRRFESTEEADAITLASLRKVGDAMDCELRYALVPRKSLREQVHTRAHSVALQKLAPAAHSVSAKLHSEQVAALTAKLLQGDRRRLW